MTRPARSVFALSQFPAGEAMTPAAQMIVRASMRSPPSDHAAGVAPPSRRLPSRTSTPSFSSATLRCGGQGRVEGRKHARVRLRPG